MVADVQVAEFPVHARQVGLVETLRSRYSEVAQPTEARTHVDEGASK